MHLYVYYKAAAADAAQLQEKVGRMQAQLGVPASLCRRPEEKDGQHTWMEVYPAAASGFEEHLESAVQQAGLANIIRGDRHAEHFVEVLSCA